MRRNEGITLVALVITIIILILLAGVAISLLVGDNGMIIKAKEGKENMTNAQGEEQIGLDSLYNEMIEVEQGNESELNPNIKEYHNGVPIPVGFYYVGGEKETGLVISDDPADKNLGAGQTDITVALTGNQYVWIPVKVEEFARTNWSNNAPTGSIGIDYTEPYRGITEADETGEKAEYEAMRKSVIENEGFYAGRYEAGCEARRTDANKTTAQEVLVQKDKFVYNYVPWGASMTSIENATGVKGAVKLARDIYPKSNTNYGVVSHLMYGVQWDSMLRFVADGTYNVSDSRSWGNYGDSTGAAATDSGSPQTTGKNEAWKAKNIYDIAGNMFEWTMEAHTDNNRVPRGGYYNSGGSGSLASGRVFMNPNNSGNDNRCFRPVLYVKTEVGEE